ncbi:hypothetical protein [Bradyrhizobium sp. BR 10289]|uniref:hypothetical protein n=1 Tax=Bradyrhizobium sp. BR 10289 TaxID=2749993 RepID=UPI001C64831A|nr:hypothetical protein [Bradyrhizobium sp. BR 10289]MBW7970280.1 hypothetical protein [Bradyrhizobium sp. BR 10289]
MSTMAIGGPKRASKETVRDSIKFHAIATCDLLVGLHRQDCLVVRLRSSLAMRLALLCTLCGVFFSFIRIRPLALISKILWESSEPHRQPPMAIPDPPVLVPHKST